MLVFRYVTMSQKTQPTQSGHTADCAEWLRPLVDDDHLWCLRPHIYA